MFLKLNVSSVQRDHIAFSKHVLETECFQRWKGHIAFYSDQRDYIAFSKHVLETEHFQCSKGLHSLLKTCSWNWMFPVMKGTYSLLTTCSFKYVEEFKSKPEIKDFVLKFPVDFKLSLGRKKKFHEWWVMVLDALITDKCHRWLCACHVLSGMTPPSPPP